MQNASSLSQCWGSRACPGADSSSPPFQHKMWARQVQSLQQMVNQFQKERDAFTVKLQEPPGERPRARQRSSPSHVPNGSMPPMPTMVPMELSDWV